MTYRRRHRWLRRLALGFAFATFAAPATAQLDEGSGVPSSVTAGGWTGMVDTETGIPLSAGIPQGDEAKVEFIQGVTDFPKAAAVEQPQVINHRQLETLAAENGQSAAVRPDDRADRFTGNPQPQGIRPDDKADRFAHSDVAPQPEVASGGWNVEWNEAFTFGIGALVLMVGLGLGLSYLRQPRLSL